jgi:tRNA dimethylallyltransferase
VIVVGPTAVGKTKLSVELASVFDGEIISADSMQIYRHMNIGTAKIRPDETNGVPHFGIDIVDPTESFSVMQFRELFDQWVEKIWLRGHLPFLVGGTGLYVRAATEEYNFTATEGNQLLRKRLEEEAKEKGSEILHQRLLEVDPVTAERLHPNDLRRIIRALEINELSGVPMSKQISPSQGQTRFPTLKLGLTLKDRETLYKRINQRVDLMLEQGLVKEVEELLMKGVHKDLISMQGIGYKEIIDFLENRITLQEAVELIKLASRRYAKRQLSWFRRDPQIYWFYVDQMSWSHLYDACSHLVQEFRHRFTNTVEIKEDGGSTS